LYSKISYTMSETQSTRLTGQVKWFNTKAGYGFITVCDGEHATKDIFVHYSSIKVSNSQYRYLVQGEYVEFDITRPEGDKYEFHAVNVSGVKGGLIMCETRRVASDGQPPRATSQRREVRRYRTSEPRPEDEQRAPRRRSQPRKTESSDKVAADTEGFETVTRKKSSKPKPAASS
jgi:CspA family cold shock protein